MTEGVEETWRSLLADCHCGHCTRDFRRGICGICSYLGAVAQPSEQETSLGMGSPRGLERILDLKACWLNSVVR